MNISAFLVGSTQGDAIHYQPPRNAGGDYLHDVRSFKQFDQTGITSSTLITDLELPMKGGAKYEFTLSVPYSVTGVAVAMSWALQFTGTLTFIRYSIIQVTMGNTVVGGSTSILNTAIGQTVTALGGSNQACTVIFGSLVSDDGGDLVLRAIPSGVGASGAVYAGSIGYGMEI